MSDSIHNETVMNRPRRRDERFLALGRSASTGGANRIRPIFRFDIVHRVHNLRIELS